MTVSSATDRTAPDALGPRMSYYRENAGISREETAIHSSQSSRAVSDWEVGQREPSRLQLARLAKLYGVTITELIGDNEVSP